MGNGSKYTKSSKANTAKLMARKSPNMGGDIKFIVKKGKVVVLTAE